MGQFSCLVLGRDFAAFKTAPTILPSAPAACANSTTAPTRIAEAGGKLCEARLCSFQVEQRELKLKFWF